MKVCTENCASQPRNSESELYSSLDATTEKVLPLITLDDPNAMTKGQQTVYMYFRRYVRSLNEKELACLLRYVTGSSTLAVSSIKVIFHAQLGNLPHVTVHACSGVVDLPSSGMTVFQTSDHKCQRC